MQITDRQFEVLDYIKRFIAEKGYSPTIREVAAGLNFKSPSSAQDHLKNLVLNGLITMDKQKSRTIELLVQNEYLKGNNNTVYLPVLNSPLTKIPSEFLEIPVFMLKNYDPKNLFIFKKETSYYIVNSTLPFKDRVSLTESKGVYDIEEKPTNNIIGNVIGEYKIY